MTWAPRLTQRLVEFRYELSVATFRKRGLRWLGLHYHIRIAIQQGFRLFDSIRAGNCFKPFEDAILVRSYVWVDREDRE